MNSRRIPWNYNDANRRHSESISSFREK